LLDHLPRQAVKDRDVLGHAPTCGKDLVYFKPDRGMLVGDHVDTLTEATDEILYGF
jgi:hypothetical protein